MGWSVAIYAGTNMLGQPSYARICMFELCRAINERQALLGLSLQKWNTFSDGPQSNVTMEQLKGLRMSGTDGGDFGSNQHLIRLAIMGLASTRTTETNGLSPDWTVANIEAAIGSSISDSPITNFEARWWQAMQDALDLILYGYQENFGNNDVVSPYPPPIVSTKSNGSATTAQLAWDHRTDVPAFTIDLTKLLVGWYLNKSSATEYNSIQWATRAYAGFDLRGITTSSAPPYYAYTTIFSNVDTGILPSVSVLVGTESFTFNTTESTPLLRATTDITLNTINNIGISLVTAAPSVPPFILPNPASGRVSFIATVRIPINMTSSLTDQA